MSHVTVVLLDNNETQLHFDGPQLESQGTLYKTLSQTFGPTMDRRVAKKLFTTIVNCSEVLQSVMFRIGSEIWVFQKDYGVSELLDYFQALIDSDLKIQELRIREILPVEELLRVIPPLIYKFHKTLRRLEVDHVMQGLWQVISLCENLTDLSVAYPEGRKARDLESALAGKFLKKLEVVAIQGLNSRQLNVALSTLAEPPTHLRILQCPEVTLGTFLPLAPNYVLENLCHLTCESGRLPLNRYNSVIKETAIEEENSALKLIPKLCPKIEQVGGVGTLALGLIKAFLDRYSVPLSPRTLVIRYANHITLREFAVKGESHKTAVRPHIKTAVNYEEATVIVSADRSHNENGNGEDSFFTVDQFFKEKVLQHESLSPRDGVLEAVKFQRGSASVICNFCAPSGLNNAAT